MKKIKKYFRYPPDQIPKGYRIEIGRCHMCNGTRYFSGKWGMIACEYCDKGREYRLVRIYRKQLTKQNESNH